jgi:hypothetical protein
MVEFVRIKIRFVRIQIEFVRIKIKFVRIQIRFVMSKILTPRSLLSSGSFWSSGRAGPEGAGAGAEPSGFSITCRMMVTLVITVS